MTDESAESTRRSRHDLWCDECGQHPRVVSYDYDGVEIRCGCGVRTGIHVSHKEFDDAPYSWKYVGKHEEEKHVQKRL